MKKYIKNDVVKNDVVKNANEIIVIIDGMKVVNPSHSQIISAGWKEYVEPEKEPLLKPDEYTIQADFMTLMMPTIKEEFEKLSDEEALKVKSLADTWESWIGKTVDAGKKLWYDEKLVKTKKSHLVQKQYPPSVNTSSLYEFINEENEGTEDDVIPYVPPMEIFAGKYYSENGVKYRCIRDSGIPLTHPLSALILHYVEIAE